MQASEFRQLIHLMGSGAALITGYGPCNVAGHMREPALLPKPKKQDANSVFSFNATNTHSYTVEHKDDLSTTNWVFQTNFLGNGPLMQLVVPVTNAPQRFFRVREP